MEPKEIKITVPEGYEIDKDNSTFECIRFKKKVEPLPESWEEYCKMACGSLAYTPTLDERIASCHRRLDTCYNTFKESEELRAFIALGKLIQLRDAWLNGWKPDWAERSMKHCILLKADRVGTLMSCGFSRILSFPTKEKRDEFLKTFKDLIEEAKMFI